ncbi:multicopper oxidase [Lineolata rhizophorae]|uniref:Multicopper oxidase n=1 Tax=Lineolata rhizophorae TaxID=578093 RepID=A0A6A6NU63_9PEZI|nr:multicopper oxidase [Lineolata rhizophorae]
MFTTLRFLGCTAVLFGQTYGAEWEWLSPVYEKFFEDPMPIPPLKTPKITYTNPNTSIPIDYYEVEISAFDVAVYPDLEKARFVGYDGMFPGPTFRIPRGRQSVVRFTNKDNVLGSSIHVHGSYTLAPFDGWADDMIMPGQYKDYYYPNTQSARPLWYHDHVYSLTADNAFYGQAGYWIIEDENEAAMGFPSGDYDLPLMVASHQFNEDGTVFSPLNVTDELFGDIISVNGVPWPYFKVEPRKYRLRWLNASLSRVFELFFEADGEDGQRIPFQLIASDGGLMNRPVMSPEVVMSMGERWEMIFDFEPFAGRNVTAKNPREVGTVEDYVGTDRVMRFVVGDTVTSDTNNRGAPDQMNQWSFEPPTTSSSDRLFFFARNNDVWQINGRTFGDVENRVLANIPRGSVEIWDLENGSGAHTHPVHLHLVDFIVLSRKGRRGLLPYEQEAAKDVVWLGPNEGVRVAARFAPWDGIFMFHCHDLIHEDHDMMVAFNITQIEGFNYTKSTKYIDPMDPRWLPAPVEDSIYETDNVMAKLEMFASLGVYDDIPGLQDALDQYYENRTESAIALKFRV